MPESIAVVNYGCKRFIKVALMKLENTITYLVHLVQLNLEQPEQNFKSKLTTKFDCHISVKLQPKKVL
jgi:hypothetical protein